MENIIFGDNFEIIKPYNHKISSSKFYDPNGKKVNIYYFELSMCDENNLFLKTRNKNFRLMLGDFHIMSFSQLIIINYIFNEESIFDELNNYYYFNIKYAITYLLKTNGFFFEKNCVFDLNSSILKIRDENENNLELIKTNTFKKLNNLNFENRINSLIIPYEKHKYNKFETGVSFLKLEIRIHYFIIVFEEKISTENYINYVKLDSKKIHPEDLDYSISYKNSGSHNYVLYKINFAEIDFNELIYLYKNDEVDQISDKLNFINSDVDNIFLNLNIKPELCIIFFSKNF